MMDINGDFNRGFNDLSFFDKNTSGDAVKNGDISDQQLAKKIPKPVIRKFEKHKVCSYLMDNIWGSDPVDIQVITKFYKGFVFCYVLLIFSENTHGLFL